MGFPVAQLIVSIPAEIREVNDFWFSTHNGLAVPKPVVMDQHTAEEYRGQGIQGRLIMIANETAKFRFKEPLSSSVLFIDSPYSERGFHPKPGLRVWEKLEKEGRAHYKPFNNRPRWIMN